MSEHLGKCCCCGSEVTSLHVPAYQITGWEFSRSKGLNAVYNKQRIPNVIAHKTCVEAQKAQGQTSLLDGAQGPTVNSEQSLGANHAERMR